MLLSFRLRRLLRGTLLMGILLLLPLCAHALTLEVSYGTPTCSAPMAFTLSADGTDQTVYALTEVSRYYPDSKEWVLVVDPSLGAYKTGFRADSAFSFQFRTSGRYSLKFGAMDKGTAPIQTAYKRIYFTIDESGYPTAEALADSIAGECLKSCDTEFERALWLHDWLIYHSDYDHTLSFCSADAALTGNKGTCEAYHRAYELLLDRVGIEHSRVTGNGHVWTGVRIDGSWCQVDVTWDDVDTSPYYAGSFYEHLYFGLTDEQISRAHDAHVPDPTRPCDSMRNNYFLRTGAVSQWTDELLPKLSSNTSSEQTVSLKRTLTGYDAEIVYSIIGHALTGTTIDKRMIAHAAYDADAKGLRCALYVADPLPGDLLTIDAAAFEGSAIEGLIIPDGCTAIGSRAFAGCTQLKLLSIPSSVTSIAKDAFEGTTGLLILCDTGSYAQTRAKELGIDTELR